MRRRLGLILLLAAAVGAPTRADECETKAAEIAAKIGLDLGRRTEANAIPLSARGDEEDDYGAYLLCRGPLGVTLRYLSPPSPGQSWFRFVGRSGAILTGVGAAAIALEAQNCVENARLRKAMSFRSPGSAFQM
ncbi:hypothetical protein, partial [Bradyrhizobium sp.]|uniref:hypothetical protein n=1 Tax=Bradyrhizobium sp. TaxID=376 RepID=UPI00238654FC